MTPTVLDATAGGKHIWHSDRKDTEHVVYADRRLVRPGELNEHRDNWSVEPDVLCDFRHLPFADESFDLVCWDPPHRVRDDGMEGLTGIVLIKYGALRAETWQDDLRAGFAELWRVLRPGGTLTVKWADETKSSDEVLDLFNEAPLYGTNWAGRSPVNWWTFHKPRKAARPAPVAADGGFTEAIDKRGDGG